MAGAQGPALCIAVCEAGGLGALPGAMLKPAQVREHIAQVRAATRAPFNINFFTHTPPDDTGEAQRRWLDQLTPYYREAGLDPASVAAGAGRVPFDSAMCDIVEEMRPAIVSFHFGLPGDDLLARVKAAGCKVLSSATTVAEARWLAARGVDAIIAQGREAGGHRGMFLGDDLDAQPGLFALLPQIVDAVDCPVVAAGGIGDARGIGAAFALGAKAVQIGTAYLKSPQSSISEIYRRALREASDDTTRLTNIYTGRPARGLLTRAMREQGPMAKDAPPFPLATNAIAPLRAAFEAKGASDFTPLWSGEAARLAREEDAGDMTRRLWREARALFARMGDRA